MRREGKRDEEKKEEGKRKREEFQWCQCTVKHMVHTRIKTSQEKITIAIFLKWLQTLVNRYWISKLSRDY